MADLYAIQAELLAGHPDTGPYSADDQTATDELNAFNRNAEAGVLAIKEYFILERKLDQTLWGRMQIVAESAVGEDPLAEGVPLTNDHITACMSLSTIMVTEFAIDTTDTRFDDLLTFIGAQGAKVIQPADVTNLRALSVNTQSRAMEQNLGAPIRVGHVTQARAL
jgi:hypothetical protein